MLTMAFGTNILAQFEKIKKIKISTIPAAFILIQSKKFKSSCTNNSSDIFSISILKLHCKHLFFHFDWDDLVILFYLAGHLNIKDLFYKHVLATIRASKNKRNKTEYERR